MAAADTDTRSRRSGGLTPYGLLSPGLLWLALFFLVPMVTLARTSLSVKEITELLGQMYAEPRRRPDG